MQWNNATKLLLLDFISIKYPASFNLASFGCDCSIRRLNLFIIASTLSTFLLNNLTLSKCSFSKNAGNVNCIYPVDYLFILENASILKELLIIK